jgi:tetratricopeptide (TPR) repeat protein
MSLTIFGWLLIALSILIFAYYARAHAVLRAKASPHLSQSQRLLSVCAAAFLTVAGFGGALFYVTGQGAGAGQHEIIGGSSAHSEDEMLAALKDYTQGLGTGPKTASPPPTPALADVDTMVARLAARLKDAPNDVKGWRMLGWSYFNMERYEEAAAAYARAVAIDPDSTELKAQHDDAKAKAAERSTAAASATAPRHETESSILAMVDGLASRLKSSPRDGWMQLMRSRAVLGQKTEAETALRDALDIFKDDSASSSQIVAMATELGLTLE